MQQQREQVTRGSAGATVPVGACIVARALDLHHGENAPLILHQRPTKKTSEKSPATPTIERACAVLMHVNTCTYTNTRAVMRGLSTAFASRVWTTRLRTEDDAAILNVPRRENFPEQTKTCFCIYLRGQSGSSAHIFLQACSYKGPVKVIKYDEARKEIEHFR